MLATRAMLALLAVSVPASAPLAPPSAAFSVRQFFAGHTLGHAVLRLFLARRQLVIHGVGRIEPDGALVLDQAIDEIGSPRKQREWRLREVAAGRYNGTLTDAAGSVSGAMVGPRFHLKFQTKSGLAAEQWLSLNPDGRSVHNVMTFRKLGLVVASLDETIIKVD